MLVDKRCKKGSGNDKVGCDLGYRSHGTERRSRQVKCKGSMNFKNSQYKLECKPKKKVNIKCNFSTNLNFSTYGKRHLTNKRYKKKRMAYLNCFDNTKKRKTKKKSLKRNSLRKITKRKRVKRRKVINKKKSIKGGMFSESIDPFSLPLSIQIHEFALFTHYLIYKEDFFFYVQPRQYMAIVLEKIYGSLAVNQKYSKKDLDNINDVCGGYYRYLLLEDYGIKILFSDILKRYDNKVPELYMSNIVGNSFKNKYGFQLLHKSEYSDKIFSFYQTVRYYFCKIPLFGLNDYVKTLKTEYQDKLGDKTWGNYNSMKWQTNFEKPDVLEFLREMIESNDDIRRLSEHYVNIFSDEIGDVRNCKVSVSEDIMVTQKHDMEGNYILVKLKNPKEEFIYDNTEMVVHRCDFDGKIPAQYHLGIMRNPSDLILNKFTKILSSDKLSKILELNKINRFF